MTLGMAVTIDKARLAAASGVVVKRATFSQLLEARQIVAEAIRYHNEVRACATAELEGARRAGHEAGLRAGREELSASMVETVTRMANAFSTLELRIVNTVMNALKQILGQLDDRTLMESLVRRVLAQARAQKQLRLKVAAAQFDEVNRWLAQLLAQFPDIELIDVVKDPAAAAGTCVLESELGALDASLEVQLAAVRRGLVTAFIDKRVAAAAAWD